MTTITGPRFRELLMSGRTNEINNATVENASPLIINLIHVDLIIDLQGVIFEGAPLTFEFSGSKDEYLHRVGFQNCSFFSEIIFKNCSFAELSLEDCNLNAQHFRLKECKVDELTVRNVTIEYGKLWLDRCEIGTSLDIEELTNHGTVKIVECSIRKYSSIIRSDIGVLQVLHSTFEQDFDFYHNNKHLNKGSLAFWNCNFNKSNFNSTDMAVAEFNNCIFSESFFMEGAGNDITSVVTFKNCGFDKYAQFNKSKFHTMSFDKAKFNDIASFQDTFFNIISIDRTIFEKGAYFDDIQIKKIDDCDRKTLRTIKLQLQKVENKIDFSRFRVYEFNAYRKDIVKKLTMIKGDKNYLNHRHREPVQLKRDLLILDLSELISDYGTDWIRALKFTLFSGLFFYCIFFALENSHHDFSIKNWQPFTNGLFRFYLITDFNNPLADERTYLDNFLSWIVFIFGKIAIAIGVFELIQSFRKFKM